MLPEEAIKEFKDLYLKRFGVDLNDEEASRRANNLVNFYKFVLEEPDFGPVKDGRIKDESPGIKQPD